jgi:3-hydroxyacyl-CoA dehydrogenase/enoyl-CoA hydratase/3-hydroxybutyryl-CoA epimerase
VLATNTSSLSLDAIAAALRHPERVVGMHFFNPVHKMPLVEVVRGRATSNDAVAVTYAFALRLGKVPVVVRDGPGFLVNRILGPYLNEAGHLLAEGASIEAVDAVARDFGMPMGPLRLVDEIGIDIVGHAGDTLHAALGERLAPSAPLAALARSGRLGRKGGVGVYRYDGERVNGVDPGAYDAMNLDVPVPGKGPPRDEMRDRLVLAMVNEAARALADGVAASAADVDLAMIMGTGFPPFRGGLLRLADERHPRWVAERLAQLERGGAVRFAPAPLLLELARADRGFYDAFPARS